MRRLISVNVPFTICTLPLLAVRTSLLCIHKHEELAMRHQERDVCAAQRFQEDSVERTRTTDVISKSRPGIRQWNRELSLLSLFVTILSFFTPVGFGQASSSSDAAGRITDQTGAVVPGAVIRLINNGTRAERSATTNDGGEWSIPNIPPASYMLRVEKAGFKTAVIPSLAVEIGKTANGSVSLAIGAAEETIEVSTLPPQLQTQEATVGQV